MAMPRVSCGAILVEVPKSVRTAVLDVVTPVDQVRPPSVDFEIRWVDPVVRFRSHAT